MVDNSAALQERLKIGLPIIDQIGTHSQATFGNKSIINVIRFNLLLY